MDDRHKLSDKDFAQVVENAPLVAIDLIVRDRDGALLVGLRKNSPAQNFWFVPGGRIYKGELLRDAFKRITHEELGMEIDLQSARFVGVFEHLYDDNYFQDDGFGTHYVVLAYEVKPPSDAIVLSNDQHSAMTWCPIHLDSAIRLESYVVHENTRAYLRLAKPMCEEQYKIMNARRDAFNNLVWQTPMISLTAIAFLFTIVLTNAASPLGRTIAAVLAGLSALMSIQIVSKHRFMEVEHAKMLHDYEEQAGHFVINGLLIPDGRILRISSFKIWCGLLWIFFAASIASIVYIWIA